MVLMQWSQTCSEELLSQRVPTLQRQLSGQLPGARAPVLKYPQLADRLVHALRERHSVDASRATSTGRRMSDSVARRTGSVYSNDGSTVTSSGHHGSQATSEMRHNGTGLERVVNATWKCAFPQGNCFANHAPLEGMPVEMQKCIEEKNKGPLLIQITVDLHCAKMDNTVHCDSDLKQDPFDPFYTCTNDPNVLKATCQISCKNNFPFEICTFQFDQLGIFNMSDESIDVCKLDAECMSPYIEANVMFCSGHKTSANFKPHWVSRPTPNRVYANHGIRGAPSHKRAKPPPESVGSELLWLMALVLMAFSAGAAALRMGYLPSLAKWIDALRVGAVGSDRPRFGTPYQAPPVTGDGVRSMQYVAPAPPASGASNNGRDKPTDQELQRLRE